MHTAACKEFYANLTVFIYKKKEIAKSRVKGVEIEFDSMKLASILDVPGHTGISEYIKKVWEESKYIKPLEITRKFANNSPINVARRVQSTEMKPFQRFVHFVVMKNVVPRFEKIDTTSFMDLTYMDHLLPYGDWMSMIFDAFGVPLVDKKGEEPKRYDYFEETFLIMLDVEEPVTETPASPEVVAQASVQQKETTASGVDPSCPTGRIPEASRANRFQADLEKAQAENARLLALLQQAQTKPKP
ncbi:hypothetical protein Dimus_002755 [Dionaea muscipula]